MQSTSLLLAHIFVLLLFAASPSYAVTYGNGHVAVNPSLATTQVTTVLFIDAGVQDAQVLQSGVAPGTNVVQLQSDADGVQQISQALKNYHGLDSIQIISHGAPGQLALGSVALTGANLASYQAALQSWGGALKAHGDILLFGCNVAQGAQGNSFVERIGQYTGASVAASTDATGASALGGNWLLEKQTGTIHAAKAISDKAMSVYGHLLPLPSNGAQDITDAMANGTGTLVSFPTAFTFTNNSGYNYLGDPGPPNGIYPNVATAGASTTFNVNADGTNLGSFDLTALNFTNFDPARNYTFSITGNKLGGGTVTTSFAYVSGSGFTSGTYTSFTGITGFQVVFASALGNPSNITFDTFTIANATAPLTTATTTTGVATSISATGATLNGNVNDNGSTTTVTFDYGTTIGYGTNIAATTGGTITGGTGATATSVAISGLTCNTLYHFRVNGVNSFGTANGSDATFTTSKCPQTITFNNPGAQNFGTSPTLTATSTSGLTPTFTSSTTGVCTITSGGTLTFVTTGSCTINADQAGNGTFAVAPQVPRTFSVNAVVPGAPTIGTATAGDTQVSVTFTAPGSNGGAAIATYTATANPGGATGTCAGPAACTITVTGLSNGTAYTFTVTATNTAGTGSASAASNSATPMGNQTITFANPGTQNFGTAPTLTATATSGLTPTFTSSTTGVCTITSGGLLTFVTSGTCTINADQAGNGAFNAAPQVSRSFTVNAVVPGAPTIGTATAGDTQASVTFTAPVSNGGSGITTYTATASPGGATGTCAGPAACTITVTGLTNGTAYTFTVTATNVAGTGSASSASNSVTPKASQTITFANPGAQNFGTTPTLTATATSSLTPTFTSITTGVCTITTGGALVTVTTGTCTINADQAGNGSFLAASTVSRSFTINAVVPGAPTIGTASPGDTQASVTFAAPAFNGGSTITGYTVTSNPGGVTGTGVSSPIAVPGLTNGISYTFTVTATNIAGTGSASAASNAVTPNPGPAVVSVAVPANGSYKAGTNLDFTVTWDQNTTVTGTPRIALVIGATTVQANYVSSPTVTTSLFRYTVLAGQTDTDGITIGALTLNGGTIQNGVGTNATLTLNSVASTAGVLVDTTAPTLPAANIVVNNQTDPQKVVLTFSESLNGTTLGSAGSWTVTANGGLPSYSVASVALTAANQVTLTLNPVDVTNAATMIFNTAANGHVKATPPATLADVAGNTYAAGLVTEAGATHVLDATAPTLGGVATSGPTTSGGTLAATASEKVLGYWIAVPQGAAAPNVAQVQAGVNYGAVIVAGHGTGALPSGTAGSLVLSGLAASTPYDIYIVAQDAAGNLSAAAVATTLTTISSATPITPLPTPTPVPGISSVPTVLDMQTGNGPSLASCVADMVRQVLGGNASYLGQTASGAMQVSWSGQILSFYPLTAIPTDIRLNGVSTTGRNSLDAVTSCGTLTVTPAIRNLTEFGAVLAGMGLTAQVSQQGVITILVNGTYYVARPDFVVTTGAPGAPRLFVGPDGLYRFSDSSGNTQILHPAFLDTDALAAQVSTLGGSMVVEIDGTVRMALGNGQQFVLTPDLILGGIPPDVGSALLWTDGPGRFRYRIGMAQFIGFSQGLTFTLKP